MPLSYTATAAWTALLLPHFLATLRTGTDAFVVSIGNHPRLQHRHQLQQLRRKHVVGFFFYPSDTCSDRSTKAFLAMDNTDSGVSAAGGDDSNAGDNVPLFVYGTLMEDKVLHALLDRVPSTKKACLSGFHRYRIKDHVFPAIRPREGGSVEGLFMTGLNAREKLIFDLFEDDDYFKQEVEVKVEGRDDDIRTAVCYVWNASAEYQLYETWDPSVHFTEEVHVPDYVTMVEGFVEYINEEGLLLDEEAPDATAAAAV